MKNILYLFLFAPALVMSQFKTNDNLQLEFEEVYEVDLTQAEIKEKTHEWFATTFNDSNHVIKINTEDKILANGSFSVSVPYNSVLIDQNISFSMVTDFKDGRYKVLINNLSISGSPVKVMENVPNFEEWKIQYAASVEGLAKSVRRANEKILKDEQKMKELYDQSMGGYQNLMTAIKEEVSGIVADLKVYVQEDMGEASDW